MNDYFHRREQLIKVDRSQRVDSSAVCEPNLSQLRDDADSIVREIRSSEAKSVWGPQEKLSNGFDDIMHVFPGMGFLTARETIMGTNLFNIVSKMPKGALLHAHLDATVNVEVLLELALRYPSIHIRTAERLTTTNMTSVLPQFRPLPPSQYSSLSSLADVAYVPGSWVSLINARQSFPADMGGPAGFDEWIVGCLTISPAEAYKTHNTTTKIWAKFQGTFLIAHPLVYYAPIWREYIRSFFRSSVEDGISYVEVRLNFHSRFMFGEDGEENIPHREWLLEYDRAIHDVKQEMKAQGREGGFIGSKIIYSAIRFVAPQELEWYLEDCISLKQEFPHLIAGFDLVGHEDSLKPLIEYIEPLTKFIERTEELGLDLPFLFHAGETLGDGTAADMNLYDAILLDTKRIGHGFSLLKHPKLMEICKEKRIAIEICPISHEVLRLTTSMPMHPLPIFISHGVPVALCSDDPAVFGNMGLSFDFFQVLVASEVTGLITIGALARDSIKYSCMDQEEQARALALWDKQWEAFLQWVVREWGPTASKTRRLRN